MKKLLFILIVCCSMGTYAQQQSNYFISKTEEGVFLVQGEKYAIDLSKNNCMESFESTEIKVGEHFVIIRLLDEMENNRGLVIFDKTGNQINFDIVQNQRKLQHQHAECCVYVEELNGKLYFYDIVDRDGNDYDCYGDSQTGGSGFTIPRYYIFEPKKNELEIFILEVGCQDLIKDGKLNCK